MFYEATLMLNNMFLKLILLSFLKTSGLLGMETNLNNLEGIRPSLAGSSNQSLVFEDMSSEHKRATLTAMGCILSGSSSLLSTLIVHSYNPEEDLNQNDYLSAFILGSFALALLPCFLPEKIVDKCLRKTGYPWA
jgi:hypothetical protein